MQLDENTQKILLTAAAPSKAARSKAAPVAVLPATDLNVSDATSSSHYVSTGSTVLWFHASHLGSMGLDKWCELGFDVVANL